ncbi:MAG: DUF1566 domain-containing protein [Deltaproteobacteria bacterium]|nr:DUF1566 domain-containing protein [Deltaproteobacteria bacterium]MBF0523952.1 DUF1566 domain-containing protein [Deltaproteobacteria bacterium]
MREDKRSLFGSFMAGSMLIFLLAYSCVASHADELPASHAACVSCKGTLSPLGRWCDNGNGTVTDMTTGLVWLKDAGWGGPFPLQTNTASQVTAYDRASMVKNGYPTSLTDRSAAGDWSLPTLNQLKSLTTGTEGVNLNGTYFFTGVMYFDLLYPNGYWSSTPNAQDTSWAWVVFMDYGSVQNFPKDWSFHVWPVRAGH